VGVAAARTLAVLRQDADESRHTFEAFQRDLLVWRHLKGPNIKSHNTKELLELVLLGAPLCVRFLLTSHFTLRNKATGLLICTPGLGADRGVFRVRPLPPLLVKLVSDSGVDEFMGPVGEDGFLISSPKGTEWMIKAHDEFHIKIFSLAFGI